MIKLTYEKNGEEKTFQTSSYYEAAVRKNKLMKQGIKVQYEDTEAHSYSTGIYRNLTEKNRGLINDFIMRARIPHTKSSFKELEQDW